MKRPDVSDQLVADLREALRVNEGLRMRLAVATDEYNYLQQTLDVERIMWSTRAQELQGEIDKLLSRLAG